MAADQRNWNYYTYVSDDGTTYNIRAVVEWASLASTGLAAPTTGAPRYMQTRTHAPRKFIYRDGETFRSFQGPVGDAASYAAAGLGDTISVHVPGETAPATYILVKKVGERVPTTISGPHLADHS